MLGQLGAAAHVERVDSAGRMSATHTPGRLLPSTQDPDTAPFWEAAAKGQLVLCECSRCSALLHLPTSYCYRCNSFDVQWRVVGPTGSVYSWTTISRSIHPSFPAPYTVVLIELDDAPDARLVGHLSGEPRLEVGARLRARFETFEDSGIGLPLWELL